MHIQIKMNYEKENMISRTFVKKMVWHTLLIEYYSIKYSVSIILEQINTATIERSEF